MIVIVKKQGETKDSFFRKFTKMFREENVSFDVSKKMFFKKPSLIKKEKEKDRIKRKTQARKIFKRKYREL